MRLQQTLRIDLKCLLGVALKVPAVLSCFAACGNSRGCVRGCWQEFLAACGVCQLSCVTQAQDGIAYEGASEGPRRIIFDLDRGVKLRIGSMLAQIWSSLQFALMKRWLGSPVHDPHCKAFQVCHAFVLWTRQRSIFAGILAANFTYGAYPRLLLWLPALRSPAALQKRPAALQMDDQSALAMPIPKRR